MQRRSPVINLHIASASLRKRGDMMTEQKTQLIRSYVARRLGWLQTQAEHPQKAILANLAAGGGTCPGRSTRVVGGVIAGFSIGIGEPGWYPYPRRVGHVSSTDLLCPGTSKGWGIPKDNMHQKDARFGQAVRKLVKPKEQPDDASVLRRFNALATASTMPECALTCGASFSCCGLAGSHWIMCSWQRICTGCRTPLPPSG